MNLTCWNCKKTYTLDNQAVDAALAAMDASKLGFYDVPCPNCGKMNRTKREEFEAAKKPAVAEPEMRAVDAKKAREKERAALEKKKGYKGK
jgi:hypothetical protein